MAVGADQDALFDLAADRGDRPGDPPPGETKRLGTRVDVMEVQGSPAFVVTAKQAPSARFLDEELLDPAAPPRDRFHSTALASVSAMPLKDVLRFAMPSTRAYGHRQLSTLYVRPPPDSIPGAQPKLFSQY
jgi:hypothetical protein